MVANSLLPFSHYGVSVQVNQVPLVNKHVLPLSELTMHFPAALFRIIQAVSHDECLMCSPIISWLPRNSHFICSDLCSADIYICWRVRCGFRKRKKKDKPTCHYIVNTDLTSIICVFL